MQITKTSPFTGKAHTQEINVSESQLHAWRCGALIQNVMPDLSPSEREFLMTGITDKEWEECFGEA